MLKWIRGIIFLVCALSLQTAMAGGLSFKPVKIADGVYAIIGDLAGPSYANDGQNSNLGFIVTDEGVVAINSGASFKVAQAFHAAIQTVTKKPLKYVINVNSQPHYWLGNAYFKGLNVPILAHQDADKVMREMGGYQLDAAKGFLKDKAKGTEMAYATEVLSGDKDIQLGGQTIRIVHFGPAHTPGDVAIWLPAKQILFAGDLVFTERLLAMLPVGSTAGWVKAFDAAMDLKPEIIIPGHGAKTTMQAAKTDTRDYLTYMRDGAKQVFEKGGGIQDAVNKIDQSRFKHLVNYDTLARRNAHQVFTEIEQEAF